MQEEARKEMTSGDSEERFDTYNEYYKLVDVVQKAALDELKVRSIDRRNMQDAKIRQLIYLCITLCAAICTVITLTPFWSGKGAVLSAAQPWHLFMLCVAFILSAGGFIYGVWALTAFNTTKLSAGLPGENKNGHEANGRTNQSEGRSVTPDLFTGSLAGSARKHHGGQYDDARSV